MSANGRPSGFHTLRSAYTPRRNGMDSGRFSNSTKNAASFQDRGVIWTGSQNPGSRSCRGSTLSQNDTVPLQLVDWYGMLRAPLKKMSGDFFLVKRTASPNRP